MKLRWAKSAFIGGDFRIEEAVEIVCSYRVSCSNPLELADRHSWAINALPFSYYGNIWVICNRNNFGLEITHAYSGTKQWNVLRLPRRDEIIIYRLRIGHTYLMHGHLLRGETPPRCLVCQVDLRFLYKCSWRYILCNLTSYVWIVFKSGLTFNKLFNQRNVI